MLTPLHGKTLPQAGEAGMERSQEGNHAWPRECGTHVILIHPVGPSAYVQHEAQLLSANNSDDNLDNTLNNQPDVSKSIASGSRLL